MKRHLNAITMALLCLAASVVLAANSPDGTILKGGATGSLTTAAGIWTFAAKPNGAGNWPILLNGKSPVSTGASAQEMEVANGAQLYMAVAGGWYVWNGSAFKGSIPPPAPTPPPPPPPTTAGIEWTCTPATTYTNGAPIPASDTQSFTFSGGPLSGSPTMTIIGTAATCDLVQSGLTIGTTYFAVVQQNSSVYKDSSAPSPQANATPTAGAPPPKPGVPISLTGKPVTVPGQ